MTVQVFPLVFRDGMPADGQLFEMATMFVAENMTEPVDLATFKGVWVACEVDGTERPVRALGLLCMTLRPDFAVCRFTDSAAVVKLVESVNEHLVDNGARGADVLLYLAKGDGQLCPEHEKWIEAYGLRPADRWAYTVR